ncbi:MAG TPA: hypothetical protein VF823_04055, partial [Anaerolineales bacterium]
MSLVSKRAIKQVLGELPYTAEVYWRLRQQGKPLNKAFSLRQLEKSIPAWRSQAEAAARTARPGKKLLIFSTLRYWVEHATLLGLALAGQGHQVTLAYLPYASWRKPLNRFDLRRQNLYSRSVLCQAEPLLHSVSLLDVKGAGGPLPARLEQEVQAVSLRDAQYTLQVEDVDLESELYRLRLERNRQAARAALAYLSGENRPDVVITPNGSILEMGVVYQVARFLGIPVV